MHLMIIGESPSHTRPEGQKEVAFSGKTSHILWEELKKYGLTRDDCFVTNIVSQVLPKEEKPSRELIKENMPRITKEIQDENPDLILTVGKIATEQMLMMHIENFEAMAGTLLNPSPSWPDRWIVPCIHPAAVARNPNLRKKFTDGIYVAAETLNLLTKSKDNCRR